MALNKTLFPFCAWISIQSLVHPQWSIKYSFLPWLLRNVYKVEYKIVPSLIPRSESDNTALSTVYDPLIMPRLCLPWKWKCFGKRKRQRKRKCLQNQWHRKLSSCRAVYLVEFCWAKHFVSYHLSAFRSFRRKSAQMHKLAKPQMYSFGWGEQT